MIEQYKTDSVSFPSLMISLIKDSLSERFAQVGKSKADKKWAFVA